jgi:hypothetical protein
MIDKYISLNKYSVKKWNHILKYGSFCLEKYN